MKLLDRYFGPFFMSLCLLAGLGLVLATACDAQHSKPPMAIGHWFQTDDGREIYCLRITDSRILNLSCDWNNVKLGRITPVLEEKKK
jgi:hypothetical protein